MVRGPSNGLLESQALILMFVAAWGSRNEILYAENYIYMAIRSFRGVFSHHSTWTEHWRLFLPSQALPLIDQSSDIKRPSAFHVLFPYSGTFCRLKRAQADHQQAAFSTWWSCSDNGTIWLSTSPLQVPVPLCCFKSRVIFLPRNWVLSPFPRQNSEVISSLFLSMLS